MRNRYCLNLGGMILTITILVNWATLGNTAELPFSLIFPLNGYDSETVSISAVVDHSPALGSVDLRKKRRDGIVKAFDGTIANVAWGCVGTDQKKNSPTYGQEINCDENNYDKGQGFGAVGYANMDNTVIALSNMNYQSSFPNILFYDGHFGTDFQVQQNTEILATASGRLRKPVKDSVNGKKGGSTPWNAHHTFYIEHGENVDVDGTLIFQPNGYSSWYLHSSSLAQNIEAGLMENEYVYVEAGVYIANSGTFAYGTENGVGPHLHYELRRDGIDLLNVVDPYALNIWSKTLLGNIFSDDFNDNSIDPEKWTYGGNIVTEVNNELHVDRTVTDQGGWTKSKIVEIDPTKPVTITRMVKVFAANRYFDGSFLIEIPGFPNNSFGISYADYTYSSSTECPVYGIAVFRNSANSHQCSYLGVDVTDRIDPLWGEWFEEVIRYDPASGTLQYSINDSLKIEYNVGVIPIGANSLQFGFHTWGWHTGHYQHVDDFVVMQ